MDKCFLRERNKTNRGFRLEAQLETLTQLPPSAWLVSGGRSVVAISMNEVITASDASASLRSASVEPSIIPSNLPLLAALLSLSLAQFLKLFTSW